MKILFCLNHYLPEQIAGTEVYVAALVRALQHAGVECKVIIPNYGIDATERYDYEAAEVIKYAEPSVADRALITGERKPDGLKHFLNIIKEEQPDLVHFHELGGSNGITLHHVEGVKEAGIKTIMTFHIAKYTCRTGTLMYMDKEPCDGVIRKIRCSDCWLHNKGESGLRAKAIKAGYRITSLAGIDTRKWKNTLGTALAFPVIIEKIKKDLVLLEHSTDAFIAITDWYRNVLELNGVPSKHIERIKQALPNPVKDSLAIPAQSGLLKIIFIGRINHFKGVLLMIDAVSRFSKDLLTLDIYGSATESAYLEQCCALAAGSPHIAFKGTIPPEDVVMTISKYDLLCLPSEVCEMAPLVIQEAFAANVPVLASDVYGNAEQIKDNENGWLFQFKNIESLQSRIQLLISNRDLISAAKKRIGAVQDFDAVAVAHIEIYKKITAKS